LNGVHQPFWMNWGRANPLDFLTPDAFHAFHKFFFDHPLKWVINIMGGEELDQHIAALQLHLGHATLEERYIHPQTMYWLKTLQYSKDLGLCDRKCSAR
jgi:hypothetical protein